VLAIFMTLGAWRISKNQVLTHNRPAIETLGAATVLCVDKTGTLTLNALKLTRLFSDGSYLEIDQKLSALPENFHALLEYGILASQKDPFDPIEKGLKEIEKISILDGKQAFLLYETYGFPWEVTEEIARDKGKVVDRVQFEEEFKKHQELSRTASVGMFKGGLADHSEETTELHTATHLLHTALRKVLGDHIGQKGSNITVERLRFDFSHPTKITDEELKKIEKLVNDAIEKNYPVTCTEMDKQEALSSGALGFFTEKYGDKVKVYTIGFSREICGGPHVSFTGQLGHFTIDKEESASAGIRRIYAHLTHESRSVVPTTISS